MSTESSKIVRNDEVSLRLFTAYLLDGNRQGCRRLVEELLADGMSVRTLYQDIFQQALYHVGELWEQNKISVAREHMTTAIVESLLSLTYPLICNVSPTDKKVIVACTPGELHQLGARMVADILEMHGWNSRFLGANTPSSDLLTYLQEERTHLLCLSLSTQMGLATLLNLLRQIQERFPDLPIAVGGQAFRWGGPELLQPFSNVRYVSSLTQLESLVRP